MGPVGDRVVVIIVLGGLSAWVLWGWRVWTERPQKLSMGVIFSIIGFSFASASAALEVGSGTYAQFKDGGFPFQRSDAFTYLFSWFLVGFIGFGLQSGRRWQENSTSI
jgi:hypothetical protein